MLYINDEVEREGAGVSPASCLEDIWRLVNDVGFVDMEH